MRPGSGSIFSSGSVDLGRVKVKAQFHERPVACRAVLLPQLVCCSGARQHSAGQGWPVHRFCRRRETERHCRSAGCPSKAADGEGKTSPSTETTCRNQVPRRPLPAAARIDTQLQESTPYSGGRLLVAGDRRAGPDARGRRRSSGGKQETGCRPSRPGSAHRPAPAARNGSVRGDAGTSRAIWAPYGD